MEVGPPAYVDPTDAHAGRFERSDPIPTDTYESLRNLIAGSLLGHHDGPRAVRADLLLVGGLLPGVQ